MDFDIKDLLDILFFLYRALSKWYELRKKKRSKGKGKPRKQKPKPKKRRK